MTTTKPTLEQIARFIFGPVPHHKALSLSLVEVRENRVTIRLPYDPKLVGDPTTGVMHGGAITSLLDSTAGCAVFASLDKGRSIATLDLRIDYMRPARPGQDVVAIGDCYHVTKSVAFVRAIAHDGDESDPVATATGTFAIFASKKKLPDAGAK